METQKIALMVAFVLGLAAAGSLLAAFYLPSDLMSLSTRRPTIKIPDPEELRAYLTIRTIVSTINAGLSICLLAVYAGIYMRTRAEFTIGLIMLAATLLLYAVASNPLLHVFFTLRPYGLSLFSGLTELFTTVAVVVLLYLSLK